MAAWLLDIADQLWRNAFAVVPLALLVALLGRWLARRPATRHAMWLIVLLWFVAPALLPALPVTVPRDDAPAEPAARPPPADAPEPITFDGDDDAPWRAAADQTLVATPERAAAPAEFRLPEGLPRESGSAGPLPFLTTASEPRTPEPRVAAVDEPAPEPARVASATPPRATAPASSSPTASTPARDDTDTAMTGRTVVDDEPVAVLTPQPTASQAEPPAAPGAGGLGRGVWTAWFVALLSLRDIIAGLPAMPLHVWLWGICVVAAFRLLGVARFAWRLRRARPAPPSVQRMVGEVSLAYGLRRTPETVMVHDHVSPLIWCGRRARLVLPAPLWSQLDHAGRRAVICHELAHLRRRDHWVRWLGLTISGLYWWHPVVWWACRRLHEEAELCCDAWVTWLNPTRRRAYAEALLCTKRYLSERPAAMPSVGIGVASSRTRWFSRRLTMVMTNTVRPRISVAGTALALSLIGAGWLTTPAWSAPGDDREQATYGEAATLYERAAAMDREREVAELAGRLAADPEDAAVRAALGSLLARRAEHAYARPEAVAHLNRLLQEQPDSEYARAALYSLLASQSRDDDEMSARLARLEAQLAQLGEELRRMRAEQQGRRGVPRAVDVPDAPAPPRRGRAVPRADDGPRAGVRGSADGPGTIVRAYELPKGKLEALCELMLRDDVPIAVRQLDEGIEVHATSQQHERFERFVRMIHGAWDERDYELSEGKLEALTKLMVRDDVPILVSPGGDHLGVRATPDQHRIFQQFVEMIGGEKGGRGPSAAGAAQRSLRAGDFASARAALAQARSESRANELRDKAEALRAQRADLEAQLQVCQAEARACEAEARALNDHAAALSRAAAEANDGQAARQIERQARNVEKQARRIEQKVRGIESKMEKLEQQAERAEDQADRVNDDADRVEDEADAIEGRVGRGVSQRISAALPENPGVAGAIDRCRLVPTLRMVSGTLRKDAQPVVAAALRTAASALREEAAPAATAAIREAAEQLRAEPGHAVAASVLERAAQTLGDEAPPVVARVLERVAEVLETDAPEAAAKVLAEVADALEAEADARAADEAR